MSKSYFLINNKRALKFCSNIIFLRENKLKTLSSVKQFQVFMSVDKFK